MPRSAVFWRTSPNRASFLSVLPEDQASVTEQMMALGTELGLYLRKTQVS